VSICAILHNRRQLRGRITLATNRRFGVVIYTAAAGNQARLACKVVNKQETAEADMSGEKFGEFVRRERGAKDIGLREMAKMIGQPQNAAAPWPAIAPPRTVTQSEDGIDPFRNGSQAFC
jgi:hypothetical protein